MRAFALFAALALVAAPLAFTPSVAHADGIERPQRPRPVRRPAPAPEPELVAPAPAPVIETGPETVTLSTAFFAGSSGGVGADIGGGSYSGTTVVVRGGRAHASAFAYAGARAHAGGRGFGHGGRGGGCGCR